MRLTRRASIVAIVSLLAVSLAGADTVVRMEVNVGYDFEAGEWMSQKMDIHLFDDVSSTTVQNFLSYVNNGYYSGAIFHRIWDEGPNRYVLQGGGYRWGTDQQGGYQIYYVPDQGTIPLEYTVPNLPGTIAMARQADPNSATNQFFFNLVDNSETLGESNGGGYAVFGRLIADDFDTLGYLSGQPIHDTTKWQDPWPWDEFPMYVADPNEQIYVHETEFIFSAYVLTDGDGNAIDAHQADTPGDLDLDYDVDFDDAWAFLDAYGDGTTGHTWLEGDFDNDGDVDADDAQLLYDNYGWAPFAAPDDPPPSLSDLNEFVEITGVPEPTTLALLGCGAAAIFSRRRRR
jgi:cyclophilin family peptidyl-prolyl cis-trans isomerase